MRPDWTTDRLSPGEERVLPLVRNSQQLQVKDIHASKNKRIAVQYCIKSYSPIATSGLGLVFFYVVCLNDILLFDDILALTLY